MGFYELPEFNFSKIPSFIKRFFKKTQGLWFIILIIMVSSAFGFLAGSFSGIYFHPASHPETFLSGFPLRIAEIIGEDPEGELEEDREAAQKSLIRALSQERAIVEAVREISPAVVSIIVSKDVPIIEERFVDPFEEFFGPEGSPFKVPQRRQKGTERREIGGGTGFIVSQDGLVVTNKHVVLDKEADYTVFTNDGSKFAATVLARDPFQDLAILKIDSAATFQTVQLGDSDDLEIGQTVIAIGNALGEFRNTVSVGVISGLGRTITASGGGFIETLEDVIQTDAAINKGNSGGPLLNLKGEVIGINTATVIGAQNIGFAIPINKAKQDITQVRRSGNIVYPFLGVRYVAITETIQEKNNLPVDYGVFIIGDQGEPAITPGSAAQEAGLQERDIILEFNNERIDAENTLAKIIIRYNPGDRVVLRILRGDSEQIITAILGERSE